MCLKTRSLRRVDSEPAEGQEQNTGPREPLHHFAFFAERHRGEPRHPVMSEMGGLLRGTWCVCPPAISLWKGL